ncbi:MAG: transcription-repair coupling factor [Alphaproteobacteria bacterium]|nr:transcription-repair coupling factor [Alphaproteobacteria bacterium]
MFGLKSSSQIKTNAGKPESLNQILGGIPQGYQSFVIANLFKQNKKNLLFVSATDDRLETLKQQVSVIDPTIPVLIFPAWDCLPYDRISPSLDIVTARLATLTALLDQNQPAIVITSVSALAQRLPPRLSFLGESLDIQVGQKVSRDQLLTYLADKGYNRRESVYEPGDYAIRGSLMDLFPTGVEFPVRIDFFGDTVETLRQFDPLDQRTIGTINKIDLKPVHEILLTEASQNQFRHQYRELFEAQSDPLYEAISAGRSYAGMEHWLPLFYPETESLLDYLEDFVPVYDDTIEQAFQSRQALIRDYYRARLQPIGKNAGGSYRPILPELLYWTTDEWGALTARGFFLSPYVSPDATDYGGRLAPDFTAIRQSQRDKLFDTVKDTIADHQQSNRTVILTSYTDGSRGRLEQILRDQGIQRILPVNAFPRTNANTKSIYSLTMPLEHGFLTPAWLVLTEQDILGDRVARTLKKKRKSDAFFDEASQIAVNDYIVHREHGVGQYKGLETVQVERVAHDCLCIAFDGGDKLFLPVENIDAISRYGNDSSSVQLDRLGSNAWQHRKAKVKKRIREVADYLIRLAAERTLHHADILEKTTQEYDDFCARFPYAETEDQLRAIEETLDDLASGKPMDRLICGDVGFGKTEVALRAAYLCVANGKQVAVIVPTTLLCRQHFHTFRQRFHGLPYKVEQLSRLVKPKDATLIRKDMADGKVDIIVATSAILSDKTKFTDLGLLIVDEEQHFGVKQKERLKTLKTDVHVLTMTATPIPRTLQLALSGVRELSLITTPPIDRLAVRTFVMPFDAVVQREAILREYHRGGQIFYVSPRIEDLKTLSEQLVTIVPEIRFIMAHGQMPPAELEAVMTAFYDREYDLLLSTNIIESGIDIPTANTLIIHRSDLFGLAQLYQLRGRVGRSKTQGYAYLTLPADQAISATAQKRLQVMQSLDTLGAGFKLASHDMDIRGAGNIVGEEQSGHIREVGVELYQHLLQEAIIMARAEQADQADGKSIDYEWTPQLNLGTSVLIPEVYVSDLGLRLALYRRIAHLETRREIDEFAAEMIDRFGPLPSEVNNLFDVVELKNFCRRAGIEKLDVGPKGVVVTFRNNQFRNHRGLLLFLQSPETNKAGHSKIRPDQKLVFMRDWTSMDQRLRGTKQIVKNLVVLAEKGGT